VWIERALDDLLCGLYMKHFLTFSDFFTLPEQAAPKVETGRWLKIKATLQSILDPIQSQTKEAFISTLCAVNQSKVFDGRPLYSRDRS